MFRSKQDSVAWAKDLVSMPGFLILDFETCDKPNFKTGDFPEVLSIAIIRVSNWKTDHKDHAPYCGDVVMSQYVKPLGKIADGAKAVHGISEEMVADKPSFRDIYLDVAKALHNEVVVAYNDSFELPVLERACKDHSLPIIKPKFSCAMKAYAAFNGTIGSFGSAKWWKLSEACDNHGISANGAHDALVDVRLTYELIKVMARG